jgi:Na+-transporting methylmalonyl-CoA/oxaloacetate decarboxylase beta subunit
MSKQSIWERERSQLEKMNKFQLNHQYKKVGFIIAIGTFIIMISMKYFEEPTWVKPVLHGVLLIGLLLISLSKEKIEDELIDSLRSQSYRLAFILAIVYSLVQPLVNYGVGTLLNQDDELQGFSYFQVLFFMLIVQLLYFWKLKKHNN